MGSAWSHSTPHGRAAWLRFSLQESTNILHPFTEEEPKPERNSVFSKETTSSLGRVVQNQLMPFILSRPLLPPLQEQWACWVLSRTSCNNSSRLDLPVLPCPLRKMCSCQTWILYHDFLSLLIVPLMENRKGFFTYDWHITFHTFQDTCSSAGFRQLFLPTMCTRWPSSQMLFSLVSDINLQKFCAPN